MYMQSPQPVPSTDSEVMRRFHWDLMSKHHIAGSVNTGLITSLSLSTLAFIQNLPLYHTTKVFEEKRKLSDDIEEARRWTFTLHKSILLYIQLIYIQIYTEYWIYLQGCTCCESKYKQIMKHLNSCSCLWSVLSRDIYMYVWYVSVGIIPKCFLFASCRLIFHTRKDAEYWIFLFGRERWIFVYISNRVSQTHFLRIHFSIRWQALQNNSSISPSYWGIL